MLARFYLALVLAEALHLYDGWFFEPHIKHQYIFQIEALQLEWESTNMYYSKLICNLGGEQIYTHTFEMNSKDIQVFLIYQPFRHSTGEGAYYPIMLGMHIGST